jgi:hypothetical protein
MATNELNTVMPLILPLVLGPITSTLMGLIKKASVWVTLQNARIKQLIVLGLSGITVTSAHLLPILVHTQDQNTWWGALLTTLLTAGVAFAVKNLKDSATAK